MNDNQNLNIKDLAILFLIQCDIKNFDTTEMYIHCTFLSIVRNNIYFKC